MTAGGLERTYYVVTPPKAMRPWPAVIALHGVDEDLNTFEPEAGLDTGAAAYGFLVVYPMAISGAWSSNQIRGVHTAGNPDDVDFIKQLIAKLVAAGDVDSKRVYATGLSNGASMVYRLACEASDRFTAVASVTGAMIVDDCAPSRPLSLLEIHGTNDGFFPFEGGTYGIITFPPVISTMQQWAVFDGCTSAPVETQSGRTKTTTWSHCRNGTSVVLDAVQGSGHIWFTPKATGADATKLVWAFFRQSQGS